MITPSIYDAIERLREPFDREPPDWIKRRKEADRIMAISTAGSSPTRDWIAQEIKDTLDAVDVFKAAALDTSKVLKKNGFVTINIDGDEEIHDACENAHEQVDKLGKDYKEMPTTYSSYYEQIKDVLQITDLKVEVSSGEPERVTIEGFVPSSFECGVTINTNKKEYNNMYTNKTNAATVTTKAANTYATAYAPRAHFTPDPTPKCKGIIRRNNTTRVDWADGTRTVIVLEEGREDMDMFHTFCIAFTKKMLGSTTAILNTIKECDTDAVEAAKKKAEEEKFKMQLEETKKLKEEIEKAAFEKAVQERMFEERVIEEAIRRISIQEERRMNREAGEDDSEDCHGISIERFAEVFRKVMGHDKEIKESTDETRE